MGAGQHTVTGTRGRGVSARLFLLAATVTLLAATVARAAGPFEAAAAGLASTSFSERVASVRALGALDDERVPGLLRPLLASKLYVSRSDGRYLIAEREGSTYTLTDPLSGQAAGQASSSEIRKISVNNSLRGVIRGVLSRFALFSDNLKERREAVKQAARYPSPAMAVALTSALEREQDLKLRGLIERALGAARLSSPEAGDRLAGLRVLAGSASQETRAMVARLTVKDADGEYIEPDPLVRETAVEVLAGIESRLRLAQVFASLYQGISLGSVLLIAAVGLAITFGVMGVINMAHGELIMLGAYTTYVVQEVFRSTLPAAAFPAYVVVAVPVAFLVAGLFGIALERGVIRFLYGRPLETLLATWGVSLILQQTVRSIFGAPNKAVANPIWMTGGIELGGVMLTYNRLVVIVFALAVLAALGAMIRFTVLGLQMRAVTQNRGMAAAMGIRTGRVDALTFGLGSGIAGVAGVALSQIGNVSPNLGQAYIVDSFMVVVFGGVGSLYGTLLGAMSIGVVNKFLEPMAGAVLGKIFVLIIIILFIQRRPRGLFAVKGRAAEA